MENPLYPGVFLSNQAIVHNCAFVYETVFLPLEKDRKEGVQRHKLIFFDVQFVVVLECVFGKS